MSRYGIFKNKLTRHPSIDVGEETSDQGRKTWLNYEMTHSPTSGDSYQEMDNPDPGDKEHPKSYVRKYLRKDRMWAKGKKLGFSLSPWQESIVDSMLAQREENRKAMKKTDSRNGTGNRCRQAADPSKGSARLARNEAVTSAPRLKQHRKGKSRKRTYARKGKARR